MIDPRKETQVKLRCRCGKKIRIPISFAGQKGKCPKCGFEMQVPVYDDLMRLKRQADTARHEVETPDAPTVPDAVENPALPSAEVPTVTEDLPFDEEATLDGNYRADPKLGAVDVRRKTELPSDYPLEPPPGAEDDEEEDLGDDFADEEEDEAEEEEREEAPPELHLGEDEDTPGAPDLEEEFLASEAGLEAEPEPEEPPAEAAPDSELDLESELDSRFVSKVDDQPSLETPRSFESRPATPPARRPASRHESDPDLEAELEPEEDWEPEPPERAAAPAAVAARPEPQPPLPPPPRSEEEIRAEKILAAFRAARASANAGDSERALSLYGEILDLDPGCARAYYLRGKLHLERDDADPGLVDLGEAIGRGYRKRRARLLRLKAYRRLGRWKGLVEELELAAGEFPSDRERFLREQVRILGRLGDQERLAGALENLASIAGDPAGVWNRRGILLDRRGDPDRARESLRKAIEASPDRPALYFNLANLALRARDFEAAIDGYRRALELDPADRQAWINLGVCYRSVDPPQRKKAMECFRRAGR